MDGHTSLGGDGGGGGVPDRQLTGGPELDVVLATLQALADPTRLRIFCALLRSERCVRDLTEVVGHPQPLVSHHLRALTRAGLVLSRPQESFRMYAINPEGLAACRDRLAAFLDPGQLDTAALPGGNPTCCQP